MKSRKKLLIISMTILASLILSGFPIMPTGTSASVASLGDDHSEDFEGIVFPSWTATGLWHLEDNSTSSYPIYGWMPSVTSYMWYGSNTTGTYNTTDPFSAGELISDQVDLSGFSSPFYLEFWSWAITENSTSFDRKSVSISSDGGSTWNYVLDVPDTADWTNYKLDISGYNSSAFRVKFAFNTTDNVNNDYRGWMIDDIKINTESVVTPGNFNLWIDQDTVANVGEVGSMDFYAHSNFTHDMNVSIGIEINLPNGTIDYVFYDDPVLITADFTWNYLLVYQFAIVGIHD
ncbi:MAG: hypothetical protein ACW97X_02590, partial [Candidatus Hodarchaeales archaeon]